MIFSIFKKKQYRQLLEELTKRDIKQRYKQSVLGYVWVIFNPLAQMIVMSIVFSQIFKVADLGVPYPIYLFVALLPWNLFSGSLTAATNSLIDNAGLLSKIYFPREILVLSAIFAKIIDFFLASSILIVMMIFYQIPVTIYILWFIPIFIIQNIFTYGLGLILSAFNLFYRDIQYLLSLLLLVWMYLTPIMYSPEIFPERYRWIFQVNPMAVIVNAYREVILAGGMPNLLSLGIALGLALITAGGGFYIFKKLEGQFADAV